MVFLLLNKSRVILVTSIMLIGLFLVGCNSQPDTRQISKQQENDSIIKLDNKQVIKISVSQIGTDIKDIKEPHKSYNQDDLTQISLFINAIKNKKEVNGTVDITKPDYLITITFKDKSINKYFTWIDSDGGSIMNSDDTHKIYLLPSELIIDLNRYIR